MSLAHGLGPMCGQGFPCTGLSRRPAPQPAEARAWSHPTQRGGISAIAWSQDLAANTRTYPGTQINPSRKCRTNTPRPWRSLGSFSLLSKLLLTKALSICQRMCLVLMPLFLPWRLLPRTWTKHICFSFSSFLFPERERHFAPMLTVTQTRWRTSWASGTARDRSGGARLLGVSSVGGAQRLAWLCPPLHPVQGSSPVPPRFDWLALTLPLHPLDSQWWCWWVGDSHFSPLRL